LSAQFVDFATTGADLDAAIAGLYMAYQPIVRAHDRSVFAYEALMRTHSDTVNMVNAPFLARERNIEIAEVRHERETDYHTLVRVTVKTPDGDRSVAGTLFGMTKPRLTEIFGITVEADLNGRMLYIVNEDKPGFIGRLGGALGEAGVNIGTFHLGRRDAGGEAILLLSVDEAVPEPVLWQLCKLPGVKTVKALKF
jgi:D-3-phosphoglycerate dehydrogenase